MSEGDNLGRWGVTSGYIKLIPRSKWRPLKKSRFDDFFNDPPLTLEEALKCGKDLVAKAIAQGKCTAGEMSPVDYELGFPVNKERSSWGDQTKIPCPICKEDYSKTTNRKTCGKPDCKLKWREATWTRKANPMIHTCGSCKEVFIRKSKKQGFCMKVACREVYLRSVGRL
jgi:hypothetical protein